MLERVHDTRLPPVWGILLSLTADRRSQWVCGVKQLHELQNSTIWTQAPVLTSDNLGLQLPRYTFKCAILINKRIAAGAIQFKC